MNESRVARSDSTGPSEQGGRRGVALTGDVTATGGGGHVAPPTGTLINAGRYGWIRQYADGSYFFLGAK